MGSGLRGSTLQRMLDIGEEEELSRPYLESLIGYSCMRAKAQALIGSPLKFFTGPNPEDEEIQAPDELVELFAMPNSLMSHMDFWEATSIYSDLVGGSLWVMVKTESDGSEARPVAGDLSEIEFPDEVWPIRFDFVEPTIDPKTQVPSSWKFRARTGNKDFPRHAVARMTQFDPDDLLDAQGPTAPAYRSLQRLFTLETYLQALLDNSGDPGGIILTKRSSTRGQRRQLEKSWNEEFQKPSKARRTPVLDSTAVEYVRLGFTPKDMEFSVGWDKWIQAVIMAYGCTPGFLGMSLTGGIGGKGTATVAEQRWVWKNTLVPYQHRLADQMRVKVLGRLPRPWHDYWPRFDNSEVEALQDDQDTKLERMKVLVVSLQRSWNEAAKIAGVTSDEVEGGDDRWVASTLAPLGGGAPAPARGEEERAAASSTKSRRRVRVPFVSRLRSKQARTVYVDGVWKGLQDQEDRIGRKARRVFEEYLLAQRRLLRDIAAAAPPPPGEERSFRPILRKLITDAEIEEILLRNQAEWNQLLFDRLEGPIRAAFVAAAEQKARELGVGVFVDVNSPEVLAHISMKEIPLVETMEVVRRQVKLALLQGLDAALPLGTVQQKVRAILEELIQSLQFMRGSLGSRALLIARTELADAANTARVGQMVDAGFKRHEWITSGDDQVRTFPRNHRIDGQVRDIGAAFSNGMTIPNDFNERCLTLEEGEPE